KTEAAAAALRAEGLDVEAQAVDVQHDDSVDAFCAALHARLGHVDILVNNAGVYLDASRSSVLTQARETFKQTFEINFYGALRLCQAFVPGMRQRNYGRVVNVSSGMGQLDDMQTGAPAYRISKTALNALTRTLAAELRGTDVLVNAVCPGW